MNESGIDVRLFMPRFGCVNERRHQLHEVIRLQMNLIVNDIDQPLIMLPLFRKLACKFILSIMKSISRENIQQKTKRNFYQDNDERAIFFCRGVTESVKPGWSPDVIHCTGGWQVFTNVFEKVLSR